ncbi:MULTISPECIES: ABC transporter substrate-binding protein/permease [Segatella]|jgi:polar amino acid transport system substrate-binding protein|uniref:ABC transporter substrate-binding protein/permease n=1 Tax=Segatella TaxID=2974251 RepID=UPI0003FDEE97|nr:MULTISPECIES: ABC transporter substrate-binding protein/permease [Segatella]UKK75498.1 ABC transporter substrate-binding protein/permease [Segatella bryantii]
MRKYISVLYVLLVVLLLCACGNSQQKNIKSPSDLSGAHIGVQLGTTSDVRLSKLEKNNQQTKVERYTKCADAIQALLQGKIDCVVDDEQPARAFVRKNENLEVLPQSFSHDAYAFCVSKNRVVLKQRIDEALVKLKNSGLLDTIIHRHIYDNIPVAYQKREIGRPNGHLVVSTNATFPPYEYYDDGVIVGIDIDVMQAIADILGMSIEFEDVNFDAVITSVQTGKADVGAAGLTVTPDRLKNVLFSSPYTSCRQVIVVKNNETTVGSMSFMDKFNMDFLVEHRYLYLLHGLGNTILITVFAIIISLILGSLIAIVRTSHDRNGNMKFLNTLCRVYLTIVRGTPTMVQLLIIYYVIFASADVSKVVVAIVAFGLNSAAYLAEVIRSGIMSIDRGQMEAGRSLGMSYAQTMRFVILPQAYKNVLPAIGNELITLLKETSISGYIGLVDLTKGSDIIRSITYDAMLPLGVVALIYLVLVMSLEAGVSRIEKKLRKNERS